MSEATKLDVNAVGSTKAIEVEIVHELISVISTLYMPAERFVISSIVALLSHK